MLLIDPARRYAPTQVPVPRSKLIELFGWTGPGTFKRFNTGVTYGQFYDQLKMLKDACDEAKRRKEKCERQSRQARKVQLPPPAFPVPGSGYRVNPPTRSGQTRIIPGGSANGYIRLRNGQIVYN